MREAACLRLLFMVLKEFWLRRAAGDSGALAVLLLPAGRGSRLGDLSLAPGDCTFLVGGVVDDG
jgi:hypothetical protein